MFLTFTFLFFCVFTVESARADRPSLQRIQKGRRRNVNFQEMSDMHVQHALDLSGGWG